MLKNVMSEIYEHSEYKMGMRREKTNGQIRISSEFCVGYAYKWLCQYKEQMTSLVNQKKRGTEREDTAKILLNECKGLYQQIIGKQSSKTQRYTE